MMTLETVAQRLRLPAVAQTITRLMMGQAFMQTGWGKLQDLDKTTQFFSSIGIPFPGANATFIGTLELVGGIALILGLGTRLFAALLSCTMIVALLTAPDDKSAFAGALRLWPDKGLTDVVPFVYLIFLGWLVAFGGGPLSVDSALFSRRGASRSAVANASAR